MNEKDVLLRPFLSEDMDRVLDILTDKTVSKTYMLPDFTSKSDAIPLFRRLEELSHDKSRYVRCVSAGGNAIGIINDVIIKDGSIELGYAIHPAEQRKGYMTAALKIAIKELLSSKYSAVICGVFAHNTASIRVMEKCGMQQIAYTDTVKYRNQEYPCIYYAASKEN